jgi:hypothetical protein
LGAPRIHSELQKLGIVVSERTVSRYLAGRRRRPSPTWHTFLANHFGQFTYMSSVLSPHAPGDDVVDASARTCRSTQSSDRLSESRQCARIDWPASVRPNCLGLLSLRIAFATADTREGAAGPRRGLHACRVTAGTLKVDSLLSDWTDGNH